MATLTCNGVSINYRCAGKGRNVVLIHGLATNHAFWRVDLLLPLARKYRVTIYDMRGHGYSEMPPSGYTSMDMVADLNQLLKQLNISRVDLIGHSFGGVVALHYAALYGGQVSSLTIADSRIRGLQPHHSSVNWPNQDQARQKLKELGLEVPEGETEAGFWLLEQLASPKWQQARQQLKGTQLYVPFGGWNGGQRTAERWLKLINTTTAKQELTSISGLTPERLATIRQPTLLLYGEHSPVLSSLSGLRECLPDCESEIIEGAGHFFPLTRPRLLLDKLTRFLTDLDSQDRRETDRIAFNIPMLINDDGNLYPSRTINISLNGVLVETHEQIDEGTQVKGLVSLDHHDRRIELVGRVVRKEDQQTMGGNRFGIEFQACSEDYDAWKNFFHVILPTSFVDNTERGITS
jgi:pimeloyl-ACP methyl ester carboxylesterase